MEKNEETKGWREGAAGLVGEEGTDGAPPEVDFALLQELKVVFFSNTGFRRLPDEASSPLYPDDVDLKLAFSFHKLCNDGIFEATKIMMHKGQTMTSTPTIAIKTSTPHMHTSHTNSHTCSSPPLSNPNPPNHSQTVTSDPNPIRYQTPLLRNLDLHQIDRKQTYIHTKKIQSLTNKCMAHLLHGSLTHTFPFQEPRPPPVVATRHESNHLFLSSLSPPPRGT